MSEKKKYKYIKLKNGIPIAFTKKIEVQAWDIFTHFIRFLNIGKTAEKYGVPEEVVREVISFYLQEQMN